MYKNLQIPALKNLTTLIELALPVIAMSFMSMAYNIINLIFVGRLGSDAVAAVGSAGFFINISWGISALLTVGTSIKVSHVIGNNTPLKAKMYVKSGLIAILILSIIYVGILVIGRDFLIGLVGINNVSIEHSASEYLLLIGVGIPSSFLNLFYTNVLIGYGDSKSPFRINAISLILNVILDPILIFACHLGINGAAFGTIISEVFATYLFYNKINRTEILCPVNVKFERGFLNEILKLGISPTAQRISFTIISIAMARIISNWGPSAIAVQKIGVQIESISYMTIGGFMTALTSLSGKAYGARNYEEQWNIFRSGMLLATIVGIVTSAILIAFPETLFSIFLQEKESLAMGREYLIILGFSQLFMCIEHMATGAFFGWGRTNIPAIMSISLTLLRIPMALAFIHLWNNSLSSVWWSISISSMLKGVLLVFLFTVLFKTFRKKHHSVLT